MKMNSKLVHVQIERSRSGTYSSFKYMVNCWYQWQVISGSSAPSGGGNQKPEKDLRGTDVGVLYVSSFHPQFTTTDSVTLLDTHSS